MERVDPCTTRFVTEHRRRSPRGLAGLHKLAERRFRIEREIESRLMLAFTG